MDERRLNVAVVGACPFPVPQGSQVYLAETAANLESLGHDVRLVVYGHGSGDDPRGLTIHRAPSLPGANRTQAGPSLAKPLLDALLVRTLRQVARQRKVDVVNAHNYEGLLVALAAGVRPIVYHAHNAMMDELPYYFRTKRLAARFGSWLDRTFPRRADRIIVPHERLAEYLVDSGCAREEITVIPPAVDTNEFEPYEGQVETPPVLYTGNLDRYQNLDLLRRAMAIVQEAAPNAKLIIATSDPRPIPWATVIHTPNFAALKETLHQDSIFAVPRVSWSGYPIKLLNAMAAGQAIVCCRSAAHPLTDGHDGLVVEDDDAGAFADAILTLMRDAELRRGLGERARRSAIEKHDPSLSAERLDSVLAGVCAGE